MSISSTQSVINVGTSKGVILPAKALKEAGIKTGDKVDITVIKHQKNPEDAEVLAAARKILDRYNDDFKNLAQR